MGGWGSTTCLPSWSPQTGNWFIAFDSQRLSKSVNAPACRTGLTKSQCRTTSDCTSGSWRTWLMPEPCYARFADESKRVKPSGMVALYSPPKGKGLSVFTANAPRKDLIAAGKHVAFQRQRERLYGWSLFCDRGLTDLELMVKVDGTPTIGKCEHGELLGWPTALSQRLARVQSLVQRLKPPYRLPRPSGPATLHLRPPNPESTAPDPGFSGQRGGQAQGNKSLKPAPHGRLRRHVQSTPCSAVCGFRAGDGTRGRGARVSPMRPCC